MGINFARPALPDLIARVSQQIQANLPGVTPQLRRSTTQILAMIFAYELYQLYAYIDNFADWFFVSTAQGIYLDRKGNPLGVFRSAGTASNLAVTINGTPGYGLPAGAVLQSTDQTLSFTLDSAISIASGASSAAGTITCTTPGAAGNLASGTNLTVVLAVAGIQANAVVGATNTLGVDGQSDASYRQDILTRLQQPPQGGAGQDYVTWVGNSYGVTRLFVYPLGTAGTSAGVVMVAPLYDGRVPSSILPSSGDLTNIFNLLNSLKPVTATVQTLALTEDTIAVTLANLTIQPGFLLADVQANIAASLQNLFNGTTAGGATFGTGITYGVTTAGALPLDLIYNAIQQSAGVNTFDLTAPTTDIASAAGHIAVLGAITY